MKKKLTAIILVLFSFMTFGMNSINAENTQSALSGRLKNTLVFYAGSPKAYISNKLYYIDKSNDFKPYISPNKILYVPMDFTLSHYGYHMVYDGKTRIYSYIGGQTKMDFMDNKSTYELNGNEVKLAYPTQTYKGYLFCSIQDMVKLINKKYFYDGKNICVISNNPDLFDLTKDKALLDAIKDMFVNYVDVNKLAKPSIVTATIKSDAALYYSYTNRRYMGKVKKGRSVEIIRDYKQKYYDVICPTTGQKGCIEAKYLNILPDFPTDKTPMSALQKEQYINGKGIKSSTMYFIWVDLDRQQTNVFKNNEGKWILNKTITCATGKNISPTVRGVFYIQDRHPYLYVDNGIYVLNWVRITGDYLFHSVLMYKSGAKYCVADSTLGKRASHGCIRMSLNDINWFYKNIPVRTTVYIN